MPVSATLSAGSRVYYVRPDGGSPEQCTGLADAPYPGRGTGQPCAWDHPFRALPPVGPIRLRGGETLVVGAGSYRMGYGSPGSEGCDAAAPWDCHLPPLPDGLDATHPTRLLGATWDSGCGGPPELWGAERAATILNLAGTHYAEIACLEVTDHSPCVEFHSGGLACERDDPPFGDWAADGLRADGAADISLRDLDIHGLAEAGIRAGRVADWTVERVRLAANGWVGWEGDVEGDDSNCGTMLFRHWTVEWNGCGETYPGGEPTGCWAQSAGGYGDGVGTGETGADWIIEDSAFLYNTSDGLDLLYHTLGGRVVLDRVRAWGNAGNQVKVAGELIVRNSLLVGTCAWFEGRPLTHQVDPCRALGNTLELAYTGGEAVSIVNSTIWGQGDGLVGAGPRDGFGCTGSETLTARNSLFLGGEDWLSPGDVSFLFYQEGCEGLRLESDHNLFSGVKNAECGVSGDALRSGAHDLCVDPRLPGLLPDALTVGLAAGSPAIDAGDNALCPAVDLAGLPRPVDGDGDGRAVCDLGAYEWQPP